MCGTKIAAPLNTSHTPLQSWLQWSMLPMRPFSETPFYTLFLHPSFSKRSFSLYIDMSIVHSEDIHLNQIGSQRYHCNGMHWIYCTLMWLKNQDNIIHWYRNQALFSDSRNRCVGMNAWTNRNFTSCVWVCCTRFGHSWNGQFSTISLMVPSPPPTSLYWYLPCASIIISFSVGNSACFQKIKWRWCF